MAILDNPQLGSQHFGLCVERPEDSLPRVNLREALEGIFGRGIEIGSDEANLKVEANALAMLGIEEIWQMIQQHVRDFSPGLIEDTYDVSAGTFFQVSASDFQNRLLNQPLNRTVEMLVKFMKNTFYFNLRKWDTAKRQSEDRVYSRFSQVLKDPYFEDTPVPMSFIGSGVGTALGTMGNFLIIIPRVFLHQFQKPISPKEFQEILKNAQQLVCLMAFQNVGYFVNLENLLSQGVGHEKFGYIYDPNQFEITRNTKGALAIQIRPDVFPQLEPRETFLDGQVTTGCPALGSRGTDRAKTVVAELFQWMYELSQLFVFPHLERFHRELLQEVHNS